MNGLENIDRTHRHSTRHRVRFIAALATITLGLAAVGSWAVQTFVLRSYAIQSSSMVPTLHTGERVLANLLAVEEEALRRGDIVVFTDPGGWVSQDPERPTPSANHIVKRILGLPGDHVVCCTMSGRVTVNGTELAESYTAHGGDPRWDEYFDVVVPPHSLWLMGDNRELSADSRAHAREPGGGFVPISDVEGLIFARFDANGRPHWIDVPEELQ